MINHLLGHTTVNTDILACNKAGLVAAIVSINIIDTAKIQHTDMCNKCTVFSITIAAFQKQLYFNIVSDTLTMLKQAGHCIISAIYHRNITKFIITLFLGI